MANIVRNINQGFWRSERIPNLTIRTTYNSTQGYKAHSHAELSIGIIQSGVTCLSIDNKEILLKVGDVILIEPNKVHACNPVDGKPRSYHMFYVDNAWCCEILLAIYGYHITHFVCDQALVSGQHQEKILLGLIDELLNEETRLTALKLESVLFSLLSCHCSPLIPPSNEDELAYQVKNCLSSNIVEPPSLSDISKAIGRPKESLIRNFRRRFGITPKAFITNTRVERAKLLLKSGMDIVDVANELGFSDQSQLHRAFVNYTASTPRQYQQGVSIFDNKS